MPWLLLLLCGADPSYHLFSPEWTHIDISLKYLKKSLKRAETVLTSNKLFLRYFFSTSSIWSKNVSLIAVHWISSRSLRRAFATSLLAASTGFNFGVKAQWMWLQHINLDDFWQSWQFYSLSTISHSETWVNIERMNVTIDFLPGCMVFMCSCVNTDIAGKKLPVSLVTPTTTTEYLFQLRQNL